MREQCLDQRTENEDEEEKKRKEEIMKEGSIDLVLYLCSQLCSRNFFPYTASASASASCCIN